MKPQTLNLISAFIFLLSFYALGNDLTPTAPTGSFLSMDNVIVTSVNYNLNFPGTTTKYVGFNVKLSSTAVDQYRFAIPVVSGVSDADINRMLSILLSAKTTGSPIYIAYNSIFTSGNNSFGSVSFIATY